MTEIDNSLFFPSLPHATLSTGTRIVFYLSVCLSICRQNIENTNEENISILVSVVVTGAKSSRSNQLLSVL